MLTDSCQETLFQDIFDCNKGFIPTIYRLERGSQQQQAFQHRRALGSPHTSVVCRTMCIRVQGVLKGAVRNLVSGIIQHWMPTALQGLAEDLKAPVCNWSCERPSGMLSAPITFHEALTLPPKANGLMGHLDNCLNFSANVVHKTCRFVAVSEETGHFHTRFNYGVYRDSKHRKWTSPTSCLPGLSCSRALLFLLLKYLQKLHACEIFLFHHLRVSCLTSAAAEY